MNYFKKFINDLITEVSYRTKDGIVDFKKSEHITILSEILDERGLTDVKSELIQNLLEKEFKNPNLDKTIKYRTEDGEEKEGKVGNLMRTSSDSDAHKKAEASLGGEDSEKYKEAMDDLGSENQPSRDIDKEREKSEKKDKSDEKEDSDDSSPPKSINVFDDDYKEDLPEDDPAKTESKHQVETFKYLKDRISL